ncbi:MAG: hypothetical protein M3O30_14730 [Planctomycetota bacterium]|nr:hypothetical protein [Planctomycetota bacterium]
MAKYYANLSKPMPASNDCLPHAAMNLGSVRGVGMRPSVGMVHRLVIEPQMHNWVLYRLDDAGGFVGDTWHGTLEDALGQARREFGVEMGEGVSGV